MITLTLEAENCILREQARDGLAVLRLLARPKYTYLYLDEPKRSDTRIFTNNHELVAVYDPKSHDELEGRNIIIDAFTGNAGEIRFSIREVEDERV